MHNAEIGADHRTKLYYFPGTRATRARWMLEELALPYDINHVDLRSGKHRQAPFLAINPLAKVPALSMDGIVIFESLAICLYLADRHGQFDLAPALEEVEKRAEYYKWMAISSGTLEPALIEEIRKEKAQDLNVDPIDMGPAFTPFSRVAAYVEQTRSDQEYLLGDEFSAADLMNGSMMIWAQSKALLDGLGISKTGSNFYKTGQHISAP